MANNEDYLDGLLKTILEDETVDLSLQIDDEDLLDGFVVDDINEEEQIDYEEIDELFEQLENMDDLNQKSEDVSEDVSEDIEQMLHDIDSEENLTEINDLLRKDENQESIDDDMLSLLNDVEMMEDSDIMGVDDIDIFGMDTLEDEDQVEDSKEQEELVKALDEFGIDAKSKKKKLGWGKKNKKNEEAVGDDCNKKSFLTSILDFFTEEVNADGINGNEDIDISNENSEILDELDWEKIEERGKNSNGNKKDKKPKKEKKAKPIKTKKEKKPKKEKPKKEKLPKEPIKKEKKIATEKIISVIFFAASIFVLVYVLTIFLPDLTEKREALVAFQEQNYDQVYQILAGKKLNDEEVELLKGATIVKSLQRKMDSYTNNIQMNQSEEAIHALIEGVGKYELLLSEASKYGVEDQVGVIYSEILNTLQTQYNLSEEDAKNLAAIEDKLDYTIELKGLVGDKSDSNN